MKRSTRYVTHGIPLRWPQRHRAQTRVNTDFRGSLLNAGICRVGTFTAFPLDDVHYSLGAQEGPADSAQRLE